MNLSSIKNKKIASVILIGLIAITIGVYQYYQHTHSLPHGLVQANGRFESDTVIIASKVPGRIVTLLAHEGDTIETNQVLVKLDDKTTHAQVAQAKAALDAATARVEECRAQLDVLTEEVPYSIDIAKSSVTMAEAKLQQAVAEEEQALREQKRYTRIEKEGAASKEKAEKANLKWQQTKDQVIAAQAELAQAQKLLKNALIGPTRIKAKAAQVEAFQAASQEAQARWNEAKTILDELTISSPISGTVTMRLADLGEVVNAGTPLFELVDLDNIYLKVFVPEIEIGKVRLGLPAKIYTDAFPDVPFTAKVRYIASRAEFTPKEIQTSEERVKLVYAVKLYLDENPNHRLTPGLPADAVIRWKEDVPWAKPHW